MSGTAAPQGRPSVYNPQTAATILSRMENGEALRAICRDPEMPGETTVRRWASEDRDGFSARFARAWELRAERLAEEIIEIADDGTGDTWVDEEGQTRTNYDVIQRSKLRVQARQWLLSKVLPGKYGEATRLELTGKDGAPLFKSYVGFNPDKDL